MPNVKGQVQPAVPYPVRPPRWRVAPADTAESADMQSHTAPVDREAATQRESGWKRGSGTLPIRAASLALGSSHPSLGNAYASPHNLTSGDNRPQCRRAVEPGEQAQGYGAFQYSAGPAPGLLARSDLICPVRIWI